MEWDATNYVGWPEDAVYYGRAGVRRFFDDWLAGWQHYEAGLEELVQVDDERVLSISWQRASARGSGVPVEMHLAEITTIRDDLIVRFEFYSDVAAARAAAGVTAGSA